MNLINWDMVFYFSITILAFVLGYGLGGLQKEENAERFVLWLCKVLKIDCKIERK